METSSFPNFFFKAFNTTQFSYIHRETLRNKQFPPRLICLSVEWAITHKHVVVEKSVGIIIDNLRKINTKTLKSIVKAKGLWKKPVIITNDRLYGGLFHNNNEF